MEELKQYVSSQIEKHRETFDPDNIRDFVDLYLQSEASDNKRFNGKTFRTILSFVSIEIV